MTDQGLRQTLSDEFDHLEAELRDQDPGPFLPGEESGHPLRVRGMIVPVRLDRAELLLIGEAAKVSGETRSEFIRRTVVDAARGREERSHDGRPLMASPGTGDDKDD